jgi:hypothetical protein
VLYTSTETNLNWNNNATLFGPPNRHPLPITKRRHVAFAMHLPDVVAFEPGTQTTPSEPEFDDAFST